MQGLDRYLVTESRVPLPRYFGLVSYAQEAVLFSHSWVGSYWLSIMIMTSEVTPREFHDLPRHHIALL